MRSRGARREASEIGEASEMRKRERENKQIVDVCMLI